MTQEELAKRLDIKRATIAMYEKGAISPSIEVATKMSNMFNCSLDYIYGKSEYRNLDEARKQWEVFDQQPPKFETITDQLYLLLDNLRGDVPYKHKGKPLTKKKREEITRLVMRTICDIEEI